MNPSDGRQGCAGFQALMASRRDVLRAGALASQASVFLNSTQVESRRMGRTASPDRARVRASGGLARASSSLVGRSQPARYVGSQARMRLPDPRTVQTDPDGHASHLYQRALSASRPSDRAAGDCPLDDSRRPRAPFHRPSAPDWPPRSHDQLRRGWTLAGRLAARLGALVTRCRPSSGVIPSAVTMPWTVAHPAAPGGRAPGQHGGWLGKSFDPFAIEGDPNDPGFMVPGLGLPDGVSPGRFAERRAFLTEVGPSPALPGRSAGAWDLFHARGLDA